MKRFVSSRITKKDFRNGLGLGLLLVFFCGCMTNQAPRFLYGPDGEKVQFKRHEKNIARDWFRHQSRKIYDVCMAEPHDPLLSVQQVDVLTTHGKPDYMRVEFPAETKEYVTEWVYVGQSKLFQFIQGELVFEGPVTDYERTLIRFGRPDYAIGQSSHVGPRSDVFQYRGILVSDIDTYRFSNGQLVGHVDN